MIITLTVVLIMLTLAHLNLRSHVINNNDTIRQAFRNVGNRINNLEGKIK